MCVFHLLIFCVVIIIWLADYFAILLRPRCKERLTDNVNIKEENIKEKKEPQNQMQSSLFIDRCGVSCDGRFRISCDDRCATDNKQLDTGA